MNLQRRAGVAHAKAFYALVALIVVVGSLFAAGTYFGAPPPSPKSAIDAMVNNIDVGLTVKAYHHDGTLFANRTLPHDIILNNFNIYLCLAFFQNSAGINNCGSPTPAINFVGYMSTSSSYCSNTVGNQMGACIGIGTSATTPTKGDTTLNAPYTPTGGNKWISSGAATCNTGSTDSITGPSITQSITGSVTITEAGLAVSNGAGTAPILFFHDTFTGIAALNGDFVTVQYTINLSNAGFTTNFCNWLAAILTGFTVVTSPIQFTMTSTASATATFDFWCTGAPTGFNYISSSSCAAVTPTGYVAIGTGSPTFTPASVSLANLLAEAKPVVSTYSGSTCYWNTNFATGGTHTVTEGAMYMRASGTDYMMFALGFAGTSEPANFGFTMQSCN